MSKAMRNTLHSVAIFLGAVLPLSSAAQVRMRYPQRIDDETRRIMKEFGDLLREAKGFSVDLETQMATETDGFKQEVSTRHHLVALRPNRLAYRPILGGEGVWVMCNGTSLYSYLASVKKYVVVPAPASLADITKVSETWKFGVPAALGGIKLLEALLADQPDTLLLAYVDSGEFLGTTEVNGIICYRLKFVQNKIEWEAFVQKDGPRLLLKVVPDLWKAMEQMAPKGKAAKVSTTVTLSNWSLNPQIPESEFVFTPPDGAEKVNSLREARRTRNVLEGTPAPDFELDLLDGGKLKLATLKGSKVVVLSFWTAQHPLGVSGLALILPVIKEYEGKGVSFFSINVRDSPEVARKALSDKGLSCPVALDREARVAKLYAMRSFFHTVVIKPDGTIHRIYLTLPADLRTVLVAELNELLSTTVVPAPEPPTENASGG